MRRMNQITALVFLLLAAYIMVQAHQMSYYTRIGPGPGFFPFWIGVGIALLSLIWLFQVTRAPAAPIPADLVPDRSGILRIGATLMSLLLFFLLVDTLGFTVSMFFFLLFLLLALGRQNPILTLVICVAGSWGLFYLFTGYLQVHLPTSSIQFIANLGL